MTNPVPPIEDADRSQVYATGMTTVETVDLDYPLFGDERDIRVYVDDVQMLSGWALSSISVDDLALATRPIEDGRITFTPDIGTGKTITILYARQPRRESQPTAGGIGRREFNLVLSDLVATERELRRDVDSISELLGGSTVAAALAAKADAAWTQTGTGATARTVDAKLREIVSVLDFQGVDPSGVTDSTAGLQAALNSGAKRIRILPGVFSYTSLTVPDGVTVEGDNKLDCILRTTSATADAIIPGHGVSFLEIGFTSSVTRTAGSYIKTASNDTLVERCIFDGYFIAFSGVGASNVALCVRPQVKNCLFRNPAIGSGSGALVFLNYSNAMVDGCVGAGPTSGQQPDFGVKIVSGDTAFVSSNNFTLHGEALLICPGNDQNVYATKITSSVFDSGGGISGSLQAVSGAIRPAGTGNVIETTITGSWFGLSKGNDGLFVGSFGTGVVDGLHINATHCDGNAGSGIHIGSNVSNWDVVGGSAAGNTLNGLYISAASLHWSVSGLKARPMSQRGPNGQYGINHGVVASDYYNIIGNDTVGNTTGGLFDGGTGTHKNVQYNL